MRRLLAGTVVAAACCIASGVVAAQGADVCSAGSITFPALPDGSGVQVLLKNIALGTHWSELPEFVRQKLTDLASQRLAVFRSRWGAAALAEKERVLVNCPSAEMTAAVDDYYRKAYPTVVPPTFSLRDLPSLPLRLGLIRGYVSSFAALRDTITYPSGVLPNRDWDGTMLFDSIRLPDMQTYSDIRTYAADVAKGFRAINDVELTDLERRIKDRALYDARAQSSGGFSQDSYGGSDPQTACELVRLDYDILGGYQHDNGRPRIFANDDAVLSEANAIYLNNVSLKWLDVGTLASARRYCNFTTPDFIGANVGDPGSSEVAKGLILLKEWWFERTSASPAASAKCSIYSAQDRSEVWDAFTADQQYDNDGTSSMGDFRAELARFVTEKQNQYRTLAKMVIPEVFSGSDALPPEQLARVNATIDADTAFGQFPEKIAGALDVAQGTANSPASRRWTKILNDEVSYIGGNYAPGDPVRAADEAAIKSMFEEVKNWVAETHRGYPIDIESLYSSITLTVTTDNNAITVFPGKISLGVGTARSKYEHYSTLLHELRHAVAFAWEATAADKSSVRFDEGIAVEGSGVAAEDLLIQPFARHVFGSNRTYLLNALAYGIRDARFAGTTDATLAKYYRPGCSGSGDLDTIAFAKQIAISYGLTGTLADNVAVRAHAGTQYLQYIFGGLHIDDDIAFLQRRVDPSGEKRVDPYVLFACSLNTPRRSDDYIAALKRCTKL
jgi:hypothetical protein